jgi:hypothetical protein
MRKSYLMRRPRDSDEEDEDFGVEEVRAKPIDQKYTRALGDTFRGKDFVRSAQQPLGRQEPVHGDSFPAEPTANLAEPLSHDERNKLSARIMKAEFKGDKASSPPFSYIN